MGTNVGSRALASTLYGFRGSVADDKDIGVGGSTLVSNGELIELGVNGLSRLRRLEGERGPCGCGACRLAWDGLCCSVIKSCIILAFSKLVASISRISTIFLRRAPIPSSSGNVPLPIRLL